MRIDYDAEADGAFVWLVDDIDLHKHEVVREVWPAELNDAIGLLLTADGRLIGIEVQPASTHLPAELLETTHIQGEG
ncbi:MAG TPA: DUF2283 domain-containing protein [Thermoanaerobaculia bacterium]|nr:DUF2283 domain-containing protein [Thermoanaerobaculia bacterium]